MSRRAVQCLVLLMLSIPVAAHACIQVNDEVIYNGRRSEVRIEIDRPSPLQAYYRVTGKKYPLKAQSTGNYRGHVAVWELANGVLYLNRVYTEHLDDFYVNEWGFLVPREKHVSARTIFGRDTKDYPVQATWFTGTLFVVVNPYPLNVAREYALLYLEAGILKQSCVMRSDESATEACKELIERYERESLFNRERQEPEVSRRSRITPLLPLHAE